MRRDEFRELLIDVIEDVIDVIEDVIYVETSFEGDVEPLKKLIRALKEVDLNYKQQAYIDAKMKVKE